MVANYHVKLILYDGEGNVRRELEDNGDLAAVYFEETMNDDMFYVLTLENGLLGRAVLHLDRKNIAKTIVVHNVFLNNSYDLNSDPQRYFKYMCENHEKFDGIVMLTHDERNDFFKKYGAIRNMFVISHPYPHEIVETDFDKRDHKKAVIVARLDPFKQFDFAIEIFAEVVKTLPDIKLEIYGVGPMEEKIKEWIKEHEMENNVFVMGFTNDAAGVFGSSALFMMTSSAEGFPLTLVESLCNGCPAIAFDIKYGPAEIITDNRTGYVIPPYNKDMYVEKLLSFFGDEQIQRTMTENAYENAPRFSTDVFLDNWFTFTETMYKRCALV